MLYLKPMNLDDAQKEYDFLKATPSEHGFSNNYDETSYEDFVAVEIPKRLAIAQGQNVPAGLVLDTYFFLWDDDRIVGLFKVRHHLNDGLRQGAGHIGYAIAPQERRKGYATRGLQLALEACKHLLPPEEQEVYLSCAKDNPGSLGAMLRNGAYIHHSDDQDHYTRIPLRNI